MPAYANKPICEPGSMGLGSFRVTCDRVIAKRGVGQSYSIPTKFGYVLVIWLKL